MIMKGHIPASPTRHPLPLCCRQQEGGAPLEEIAASFARFFGSIDLEKLDILVGFVLVEVLQASICGGVTVLCVQPTASPCPFGCLHHLYIHSAAAPATPLLPQVQQRKAAIADRLRQAGIPIKHSRVPGGGAQQEAAGSAPGGSSGGGGGSAGSSTCHARCTQQHMPRGDSTHGSLGQTGAAAGGSHGGRGGAVAAGDGDAAPPLDGAAGAAQRGDVCIDVERGFRQWMREVSGDYESDVGRT